MACFLAGCCVIREEKPRTSLMEIKDRIHTLEGQHDLLALDQRPPRHPYGGRG